MPKSIAHFLALVTGVPAGLVIAGGDDPRFAFAAILAIAYALAAWLLAFALFHRRRDSAR